ncbi:hypothetical protein [Streptomyces sp. NPDC001537]
MSVLYGMESPEGGTIRIDGRGTVFGSPSDAMATRARHGPPELQAVRLAHGHGKRRVREPRRFGLAARLRFPGRWFNRRKGAV